jgi:pyruvate dehydrogenase (quinone)
MARAMGIHAVRVEDPGDLQTAIRDVLAHDGPAVLDVVTATQELSMPPTITVEQIKGFSLWVLRAVMSGRGDEVLDLAKPVTALNGVSGIERRAIFPSI